MASTPNIIIITTHDSGQHFGCYGAKGIRTPNIDALAASGAKFTSMFSTSSICTPSRGSLLTGQWPERNGLYGLSGREYRYELRDARTHLSYITRDNGYRTALFGHQHEAINADDLGFDMIYPMTDGGEKRNAVEICVAASHYLRDIDESAPFYLQIGFHETHTPYIWGGNEPDDTYGTWTPDFTGYANDDADLNDHIAELQASIHRVDEAVGVILKALEESGLSDNTIILFNTDHGVELPRAKWTMLDPGSRVAFILRWPDGGISGGTTVDALLGNVDFLPTLSTLTGLRIEHDVDGVDFSDILTGKSGTSPRSEMYHIFAYGSNTAVRTERFKYVRNFGESMFNADRFHEGMRVPTTMLFDLHKDPLELHNVADVGEYSAVAAALDDELWQHLESVESPLLQGHVYHPPVRDLYDEYRSREGTWAAFDDQSFSLTSDGTRRLVGEKGQVRIVVEFGAGTRTQVFACYDLSSDPECNDSMADKPEYREQVDLMKTLLWARLEKTDHSILKGITPTAAHTQCLADYESWKARR